MARTIRVIHFYRGAPSGGRAIPGGEYSEDDPALFGLAEYLVQNGHAVWVGTASAPVGADESVVPGPGSDGPGHGGDTRRRRARTLQQTRS